MKWVFLIFRVYWSSTTPKFDLSRLQLLVAVLLHLSTLKKVCVIFKKERHHMLWWVIIIMSKRGPRMEPCGTPKLTPFLEDSSHCMLHIVVCHWDNFGTNSKRTLLYYCGAVFAVEHHGSLLKVIGHIWLKEYHRVPSWDRFYSIYSLMISTLF